MCDVDPIEMKIAQMTSGPGKVYPEALAAFRQAMYDLYGLCAGRLFELVNYLQESH